MIAEGLRRLYDPEYAEVWDRFDAKFDFRPSIYEFPGITEPSPSITWSLDELNDDPGYRKLDRLVDVVQDGLASCSKPGSRSGFWTGSTPATGSVRISRRPICSCLASSKGARGKAGRSAPTRMGTTTSSLRRSLRFGTFGHPWEHSLCVFAAELLDVIEEDVQEVLHRFLRRTE